MKPKCKWLRLTGFVIHALISALLIFAGSGKVFGFVPPEQMEEVKKLGPGVADNLRLIGIGEITCAILLLLPRIATLGVLLTSAFWGGVICIHLAHGDSFLPGSILLVITWIGAFLRGVVSIDCGASCSSS